MSRPGVPVHGAELFDLLDARDERYRPMVQSEVDQLIFGAGTRYGEEIETFLNLYRSDMTLTPVLEPLINDIREYTLWLRWLGWNVGNLGPAVYGPSAVALEALTLGLLAYAAGRLIDDGIDNHETYKGRCATLVGALRARCNDLPTYRPCAQSVYVGFGLFQYALRRMRQCGHGNWASECGRLFDALSVGVLAETLLVPPINQEVYRRVIQRKSVAYNLILYKTFLGAADRRARGRLLVLLARMDELAQLVNDYVDLDEDAQAGTLNAVTFGVCDRSTLELTIQAEAASAWAATESLAEPIRDALAVMLRSVVQPYRERAIRGA